MFANEFELPVIRLGHGVGTPGKKACWMSALSVVVGDKWTDRLECVDKPINTLCIWINDFLSDDESRSRVILSRLFEPLNTAGDPQATERRNWFLLDFALRQMIPDFMDAAGLGGAEKWRELPSLTDGDKDALALALARALDLALALALALARALDPIHPPKPINIEQYVIETVMPVLDKLIEMGPHARREEIPVKCTRETFIEQCGALQTTP